ncbi:MAG: hypothetical protein U5R31_06215 [Acidimicrobiia bacterium]|nr:hypothetical protein [Acidimicrobiia bacterium]
MEPDEQVDADDGAAGPAGGEHLPVRGEGEALGILEGGDLGRAVAEAPQHPEDGVCRGVGDEHRSVVEHDHAVGVVESRDEGARRAVGSHGDELPGAELGGHQLAAGGDGTLGVGHAGRVQCGERPDERDEDADRRAVSADGLAQRDLPVVRRRSSPRS